MKPLFAIILLSVALAVCVDVADGACPEVCMALYQPVCGLVGNQRKTFGNKCELERKACMNRESGGQPVKFLRSGSC